MDMITAGIKQADAVDIRCRHCFLRTYNRLFDKYKIERNQRLYFFMHYNQILLKYKTLISPEIQQLLNEKFCEIIGVDDPFEEEKSNSNKIAMGLYARWKNEVLESSDPFNLALRLAVAGNIMDYGAYEKFDIRHTIQKVLSADFTIDASSRLKNKIKKAKKILYLGDNAGEIVFDKIFIETIMHNNLTYVVRGASILNDATLEDAKNTGMDLAADVFSNGYGAPSTILRKCSREFQKVFQEADLIISKGQGNLEGLITHHDPRIFFLLMVKCDVIADLLQVQKGDFVVYNQN
ncbi:MAG TPA: ARMT1-like domain-containing protein [Bacteroidales bacterium]|nr:ARMT1-like domain-containing protein [Bacteroidales bacterium]